MKSRAICSFSFGAPRMDRARRIFHYTTSQQFCQAKSVRQIAQIFSRNFVQNYLLHFGVRCAILISVKGSEEHSVLTGITTHNKKNYKNPLTSSTECAIIKMSKGIEKSRQGRKKFLRNFESPY